ncbi:molybdopterin-binding protein [Demequina lutea]|uniref:Molybdopterin molybdenumtransferase n=1 Tax=Demequina lutea TaxID=431489 RepID=A0A7Y9ZAL1_9MICO|nr:gephyrin-like molybdotransferase Glp [Demequina lutea]NYI40585.1 molybdopterin molybdotransferase [Demequina lutea]
MTSRSLEEHRADVVALFSPLAPLNLSLADAVGCVSVADYAAPHAIPPLALAARDGFAVRSVDTQGARMRPVTLAVTHDALPGGSPTRLVPGAAVRVARGAALPFGADAVVMRGEGTATSVILDAETVAGAGVVPVGHEITEGDVVVAAGTRLSAGHVAALAACGAASMMVRPAPRVVIIAVGSELQSHGTSHEQSVAASEPIADATGPMLSVLFSAAGARVVRVMTVPDDAPALRAAIDDAALQADLVITVGGLSTEWSDIVGPVLSHAFGVEVRMVRLSPGSRHGLGTIGPGDGRPVALLALPGHPVDAAAAFASYVVDAVAELRGVLTARVESVAGAAWASPFGFAQVVAVVRCKDADAARVEPIGDPAAPTLRDLAASDGLCLVPESTTEVRVGDAVDVLWWPR